MNYLLVIVFSVWTTLGMRCLASPSVVESDSMFKKANEALSLADFARDHHSYRLASTLYSNALNLFLEISTNNNVSKTPEILKFKIAYCENQLQTVRSLALKEELQTNSTERSGTKTHLAETPIVPITSSTATTDNPLPPTRTPGPANNINIESAMNKASTLLANNQPAEAREILLSVLKVNPDRTDVRMLLVAVQCALKHFDDAYYIADALVEEMPSNPSCHILKATALFGQGNLNQAELSLLKAIELDPRCTEAHFNLAQLFLQMNPAQIEKARYHYMKALSLGVKRDENLENLLKQYSSTTP